MAIPKHLDESAKRLREASARIEATRQEPFSLASARQWLEALTDFTSALADIQTFNNESVHEKLHHLAERAGLQTWPQERVRFGPE